MVSPRVLQSDYMHFAKLASGARYNLATSGVADCVLSDIGADLTRLELHGPNFYGWGPLEEAIAARFHTQAECVVPSAGTSFANHQAFAVLVEPGDEVIIEEPTYELMVSALGYFQADLKRVPRCLEDGFALDIDRVRAAITPKTRLVVLTNLHNPSSRFESDSVINDVADAAAKVGAIVLVDEVYRPLVAGDTPSGTSFRPDRNIVVTSSLTKTYGLSGLRCGWILAPAELAGRMRRLDDLYSARAPFIMQQLSLVAFDCLAALRARAEAMIAPNRAAYREVLGSHPALEQAIFNHGTTIFPRLKQGNGDALLRRLQGQYETSVVPGRFFGLAHHFRVGLGGDPDMTRTGLERLADALETPL